MVAGSNWLCFHEQTQLLGADLMRTIAYHPTANGMVGAYLASGAYLSMRSPLHPHSIFTPPLCKCRHHMRSAPQQQKKNIANEMLTPLCVWFVLQSRRWLSTHKCEHSLVWICLSWRSYHPDNNHNLESEQC